MKRQTLNIVLGSVACILQVKESDMLSRITTVVAVRSANQEGEVDRRMEEMEANMAAVEISRIQ